MGSDGTDGFPRGRSPSLPQDGDSGRPEGAAPGRSPEAESPRRAPLDMEPETFRELGHDLVDDIADFLHSLPRRPVTPGESPAEVREALDLGDSLAESGEDPAPLLKRAARALFDHSLFNGHPRFWGYITSSPAPIGVLGDFLAAAVNPNVGAWKLSPIATEIEVQTVRWIAQLVGYPDTCGGLLVSGGNMANFVGFLAARKARADWDVRTGGMGLPGGNRLRVYASSETHTWIQKAVDLFGLGTDSIRWIPVDARRRIDVDALRRGIVADRRAGARPFLVVGTAGSVSTGAIDPLSSIASICHDEDLWFHVDGAYGAVAATVPELASEFEGLGEADSVAVDPHKWLYAPLEAGCALVRSWDELQATFSYHPPYYHFDEEVINYFDYGLQNSRGFRALKVWLALRQAGRSGYVRMIAEDVDLARELYRQVDLHPELEAMTQSLSIATFRYVPPDLPGGRSSAPIRDYLDRLNREVLSRLERDGETFLSNAVIDGAFALRLCIVNFRSSIDDVRALPEIVARAGRDAHAALGGCRAG